MNLTEFEETLTEMSIRSKAFELVKAEMIKRGHWKNQDRGMKRSAQELKARSFTALSIQGKKTHQSIAYQGEFTGGM